MQYKTAVLPSRKGMPAIGLMAALGIAAMLMLGAFLPRAHATVTPTLSLSPNGDGDSVTVNVYGDPSASVYLFYAKSGAGSSLSYLGMTNSNGSLSAVVSSAQDGIVSSTPVHVTTDGINGPVSLTESWPTVNAASTGITLSQTGLVLTVGQSSTISVTNNAGGTLYVYNNSNPPVANTNISGNSLTVTGNTNGSTTLTICSVNATTNCPSVYVTVQNSGAGTLSFSQNTITIGSGQSVPVTMTGGNGVYEVLNNSNPGVITYTISGNTITLSTTYTTGSSSLTVCSTDMSACGIINASAGTTTTSTLSFSQTNPTVSISQTTTVAIYGGSGSYYVNGNTSPNVVQPNITGSTLTLTGLSSGSSTVTVCSSTGGCATLTASVNYSATGGALTLSQTQLSLLAGQTLSITMSGGTAPYSLTIPSSSIYQASINGNILSIQGLSAGSAQIAVCSAAGGCVWLSLQVNGSSAVTGNAPVLSQSSVTLVPGQTTDISISGGGTYYVSGNGTPTVASATLSGNQLVVSALNNGTDSLTVCQSGGSCSSLYVSVSGVGTTLASGGQASLLSFGTPIETLSLGQSATVSILGGSGSYSVAYSSNPVAATAVISGSTLIVSGQENDSLDLIVVCSSTNSCGALPVIVGVATTLPATTVTSGTPSTSAGDGYDFTNFLTIGSSGTEVAELQKRLGELGYFNGSDTGYYGALTAQAVKAFQAAHGLPQAGYVGPSTRAALNQ